MANRENKKAAKTRRAREPVHVPASISSAQGRSGGPWARPAPPLHPRGGAPGKPWKILVKPYGFATCAWGLMSAPTHGAEPTRDPAEVLGNLQKQ